MLIERLASQNTKVVLKALAELRHKNITKNEEIEELLISLLDKTNAKILDHSLSILANMLMDHEVRTRFRRNGGALKIIKIINNLEDPGILRRGFRAVSNAALDPKMCRLFHQQGIASILGKRLKVCEDEDQLSLILVRCIRIVSDSPQYRSWLDDEGIYDQLTTLFQDITSPKETDDAVVEPLPCPVHPMQSGSMDDSSGLRVSELTKALVKCLAKLSRGANQAQAEKIMPAVEGIIRLANQPARSSWEHAVTVLVNLSQFAGLRPSLGNAGVVGCLVDRFRGPELTSAKLELTSSKSELTSAKSELTSAKSELTSAKSELTSAESRHIITTLCLYCRESVNRVKLRELGGCRVLVQVLEDEECASLHDRIINSLLQFLYDNQSLNVLMSVGLIPRLVAFLHKMTQEEMSERTICSSSRSTSQNTKEEETQSESRQPKEDIKDVLEAKNEVKEDSGDEQVPEAEVPGDKDVDNHEEEEEELDGRREKTEGPVFRLNSPSYQAVQHELEQFMHLRQIRQQTPGRRPSGQDYNPASPSSQFQSPDRSPLQLSPSSGGYSPDRSSDLPGPSSPLSPGSPSGSDFSVDYSPTSSPPFTPPPPHSRLLSFSSTVETFSDDEIEEDEVIDKEAESGLLLPDLLAPPLPSLEPSLPQEEVPLLPKTAPSTLSATSSSSAAAAAAILSSTASGTSSTTDSSSSQPPTEPPMTTTLPGTAEGEGNANQTAADSQQRRVDHHSLSRASSSSGSPAPTAAACPVSPESMIAPPPSKRPRLSLPNYKYSASPIPSPRVQPANTSQEPPLVRIDLSGQEEESRGGTGDRLHWILMLLSRLTQAERPHEDLTSARTVQCLVKLMCVEPRSVPRIARIFSRLSKNLYCLFPFLLARHCSWIRLHLQQVTSGGCGCEGCEDHYSSLREISQELSHNLTLLAETGYGEGEMCHRLVTESFSLTDKQNISISSTLLVKQRRKLRNILINHGSLEVLLDIIEQRSEMLMADAVLSLSVVAGHLGIVAPNLTLPPAVSTPCKRLGVEEECSVTLVLDTGEEVTADRHLLASSSPVMAAMLEGGFSEASKSRIPMPLTSGAALVCVVHYLYGCDWCHVFQSLSAPELLEILAVSDKYLLEELNIKISHQIIRGCMREDFLIEIYRSSLQCEYPVRCSASSQCNLSSSTICTLLVSEMNNATRTQLIQSLMLSELRSDFLDDVNKMIREAIKA